MLPGVLVSGNIVFDILVRPVDEIRWHETAWVEQIERSLGGNGANTSYTLGKLGVPVRLLSRAGSDPAGDECLARLAAAGVDVSGVERRQNATATTVVLVHASGARKFLHRPGVSADPFDGPLDFPSPLTAGFPRFHLANPFALPGIRPLAAETLLRAKRAGLATSLDTGWDARGEWIDLIGPCLPHVDLLFANEEEARMLSGRAGAREAARALLALGAGEVVIKRGADGCLVLGAAGEIESPSFPAEALDTTGAGDCFAGAYLAALSRGLGHCEAARMANAVGALSIRRLGATGGLLSWVETVAWVRAMEKHER